MYTLVIASQKGGSGKTTLSGHLAVEAERAGAGPVALIDTDPQGSLAEWWNARKASTPAFVKVGSLELEEALAELEAAGIRLAIVDTPPAITGAISKVVSSADLVVIPTRPSPHDLRAVGATVDIAERAKKPLIFVINDATARARITGEAAVALSQHGTVAPVTLHHRVDFVASMVDGRTVGEVLPQSKSSEEVKLLWDYVADRLRKLREAAPRAPSVRSPFIGRRPSLVLEDMEDRVIESVSVSPIVQDVPFIPMATAFETEPLPSFSEQIGAFKGEEKRDGQDRRDKNKQTAFGGIDRRSSSPFGRRRSDRVV